MGVTQEDKHQYHFLFKGILTIFGYFFGYLFLRGFSLKNPALLHTTAQGSLIPCQISEKTNVQIPRKLLERQKDGRKYGQKDGGKVGQTTIFRTIPAMAEDPIKHLSAFAWD